MISLATSERNGERYNGRGSQSKRYCPVSKELGVDSEKRSLSWSVERRREIGIGIFQSFSGFFCGAPAASEKVRLYAGHVIKCGRVDARPMKETSRNLGRQFAKDMP